MTVFLCHPVLDKLFIDKNYFKGHKSANGFSGQLIAYWMWWGINISCVTLYTC